jgi:hypothetical protein
MQLRISTFLGAWAITSMAGLVAEPVQAAPVYVEVTLGDPGDVEFGQRLSDASVTAQTFEDTDNDGMIGFAVDTAPIANGVSVHVTTGLAKCSFVFLEATQKISSSSTPTGWPMLVSNDDLRQSLIVLVEPAALAGAPLALGQILSFVDGLNPNLLAFEVRTNPNGIDTVSDYLLADPSSFPASSGARETRRR